MYRITLKSVKMDEKSEIKILTKPLRGFVSEKAATRLFI